MDNTITFELPADEYMANVSYDHTFGSDPLRISLFNQVNRESSIDYNDSNMDKLSFPTCSEQLLENVSINKVEIDTKSGSSIIRVELQSEDEAQNQAIRDIAGNCGINLK